MTKHLAVAFSVFCVLIVASPAEAAFVAPFDGNSQFTQAFILGDNSDGVVNFAVYAQEDNNWRNDFAGFSQSDVTYLFGGGAAANSSTFVYFYQVVNTNPAPGLVDDPLLSLQVLLGATNITGAGYIANTVFVDGGGPTGPAGNARLGALGDTAPSTDDPGDALPLIPSEGLITPVAAPGFAGNVAAIEPTSVTTLGIGTTQFNFSGIPSPTPALSYSSIVFITSNFAPGYLPAFLRDTGATSNDIPSPVGPEVQSLVPELGTFAMGGIALMFGGVALAVSRKRQLSV